MNTPPHAGTASTSPLNRFDRGEKLFHARFFRFCCIFLLLFWMPVLLRGTYEIARAEPKLVITVSSPDHPELAPLSCYRVKKDYRVFIPGNWDITRIILHLEGADQISVEGKVILSDEVADLAGIASGNPLKFYLPENRSPGTLTVYQGSRIPSIHISADKKELKSIRESRNCSITEGRLVYTEADGSIAYNGALDQLKGRGNTTFSYPKKPYQFKLASKTGLSGMGKGKTWILLANWQDISQLRNQVILNLARYIGLPYSLRCQPADLFINGEYKGLYLLTEKIQIGKGRINITNLESKNEEINPHPLDSYAHFKESTNKFLLLRGYQLEKDPEDITGGYLIELEKAYRFKKEFMSGFQLKDRMAFTIKEPTQCSVNQTRYVADLFSRLHASLNAADGFDPGSGVYYADLIDVPSFAKKYLVEEFSKNYDAQSSSQFMFKDSDRVDPLIYAGPCWDYDLSCGNIRNSAFEKGSLPTGDYLINAKRSNSLWHTLAIHPDFEAALRNTYQQIMRPALAILTGEAPEPEDGSLLSFSHYQTIIERSAFMNYARWSVASVKGYYTGSGKTFIDSCDYLKDWLLRRKAFLDEYWKIQE